MFTLEISIISWILLGAAVVAGGLVGLYYRLMTGRVTGRRREDSAEIAEGCLDRIAVEAWPAVSVIVYVNGETTELTEMLPMVLEQDYPAPMEVIVVNDGDRGEIEGYIGSLEMIYSNLYMTFTPADSRNLSRKKLSLMLGIKAARYDALVFTTAACRPVSAQWLKSMMRHVVEGAEIVIGHSVAVGKEDAENGRENRRDSFDTVMTDMRYLSRAIKGHPYRADGNNLAYLKDVFTANRGFSSHMNFRYGDDDIFIQQVTDSGRRCAVELSDESMLKELTDNVTANHRHDKLRYNFTGRYTGGAARRAAGLASAGWWLWLLCLAGASLTGLPSLIPLIAAVVAGLATALPVMVVYRRAAREMYGRPLFLTVPWLMLWYPFYNSGYRITGWRKKANNLNWTSDKYF